MIEASARSEEALGDGQTRRLSQGEMINRENLWQEPRCRAPAFRRYGAWRRRPQDPQPRAGPVAAEASRLVGRTLRRDMREEDFFPSDLADDRIEPRVPVWSALGH